MRIVGPDGRPIPNVEVDFLSEPRISPGHITRGKLVSQASYGATLQSDGEGRIALVRPTDWNQLEICIDAPGYARFWRLWQPYLCSDPIPVELTAKLETGWSVGGTIVDSHGKPIASARIYPPSEPAFGRVDALKRYHDRAPQSDAEGRWRFDCVPLWRDPVIVEVDHPQFLGRGARLKRAEFGIGRGQKPAAKIVLSPGLTVTGRVTDKSGEPVAGAVVQTSTGRFVRKAVTDADGVYKLVGCEEGPKEIIASAKGFAPVSERVHLGPDVAPVAIQLSRGGTLRLRILDAGGRPIPKAEVFVSPFSHYEIEGPPPFADSHGAWEWSLAPLAGCFLSVVLPDGRVLRGQSVSPRAEAYDFRAPPDLVVSGKVVDALTKQPIERFRVVPGGNWSASRWLWADSFESTGGSYWIRRRNALDLQVRIEADGYLPAESGRLKQDLGHVTVDFALTKGDDIAGNVVTADGKPAAYAKVAIAMAGAHVYIPNGELQDYPMTARRVADEAGRFHFPREKADYWLVVTHPSGYAERKCSLGSDPKDLRLTPWARLEGTYTAAGKPQPSASISILSPMTRRNAKIPNISWNFSETTDFQGRYVFDRLLPGRRTIGRQAALFDGIETVGMISVGSMSVQLESGKTTHFDLGESGRPVIGQLRWPPDAKRTAPWNYVVIGVQCADPRLKDLNPSFTATLDAKGNFAIDGVPAGDYELNVRVGGSNAIQLEHSFSVPAVDKKLLQRPVDLGVLTLKDSQAP
ncbi:MAG TPA: carboxypeptidase-like regulatory domain-containing protein [Planctomycetaceae bacterium]|nr:carboxypeptidase-like regulatory domain-containing protein [Planctomycetaceae bacterium]